MENLSRRRMESYADGKTVSVAYTDGICYADGCRRRRPTPTAKGARPSAPGLIPVVTNQSPDRSSDDLAADDLVGVHARHVVPGAEIGVVGMVDGRTDDVGVDGRGEDGAPGAAGGEHRGHVGDRKEVPRREEGEEEDLQRLMFRGHWRVRAADRQITGHVSLHLYFVFNWYYKSTRLAQLCRLLLVW